MAPTERHGPAGKGEAAAPDPADFVREMVESVTDYARAERDHFKLEASERIGAVSGRIVLAVVLLLLLNGVVLMLSVAWGLWLGQCFDDPVTGFLLAGATYLALMLLFYLLWRTVLRDRITLAVVNATHGKD
ncbi:MAG: phage holin family protein [Flavobacteriales bacterium]|nr:phage holin family protein [Flavobacteriales bacterium]